jgi:integrase
LAKQSNAVLFRDVAEEWLRLQSKPNQKTGKTPLGPKTIAKKRWLLDTYLYPAAAPGMTALGDLPIGEISSSQLLAMLRKVEEAGKHETAHRARALASTIFCYGVATDRTKTDPSWPLRKALAPVVVTHHASITDPEKVGELLVAIDSYHGEATTRYALMLAPLLFVRPGELRFAQWAEFNLTKAEWRVPLSRMKMGDPHIIPLSKQVVRLLQELQKLTGGQEYLFPSHQTPGAVMSNNTLGNALDLLGYPSEVMTAHGFRSMASTLLNEQQRWHPDAIERQLAHCERNKVRATYNYAKHLPERRKMMQAWANYLDRLRNEARERIKQQRETAAA